MVTLLPPLINLETVTLRCALGIRFRDVSTGDVIASGLSVSAAPVNAPLRTTTAQINTSGVWVFNGLAGLRGYERGTDQTGDAGSPPGARSFLITVQDMENRFLPCTFTATAPTQGLFQITPPGSPPWPWSDVPLFPAPWRAAIGCAMVRMSIAARTEDQPAAWALVRVTTTVRSRVIEGLGVADARGCLVVMFPWPELIGLTTVASPPGGVGADTQGWDLKIEAWHDFDAEDSDFADLDAILLRLGRAPDTLSTAASPPGPITNATLTYGRELVVPEAPAAPNGTRILIITPAA
jgi:hypothetical protein